MEESGEMVDVQYYIVALLDVLGHRDEMRRLEQLPRSDAEKEQFTQALKQTFGIVQQVRGDFKRQFDAFINTPPPAEFGELNRHQRELLERLRRCEIRINQFADTVIAYAPIFADGKPLAKNAYAVISTCATVMLLQLARGTAIRGGIAVGIGIEDRNELFGPALLNAYELEQSLAQYPRIVVGDTVTAFLNQNNLEGELLELQYERFTMRGCRSFLTTDTDGALFVDYLQSSFLEILEPDDGKLVSLAYDFVQKQHAKYVSAKNYKLAERYARLLQYFEVRVFEWEQIKKAHALKSR